jgi:hypothetical protein
VILDLCLKIEVERRPGMLWIENLKERERERERIKDESE